MLSFPNQASGIYYNKAGIASQAGPAFDVILKRAKKMKPIRFFC